MRTSNTLVCAEIAGLQGEHTHYRREPVHTQYELLCTHDEMKQPDEYANRLGI
jgi:hypothetical protein